MTIATRTMQERAIWPCHETRWGDRRAYVFTHPDTGLRVVVRERFALATYRVFVAPPAEIGDSELYKVADELPHPEAAKDAAMEEIKRCRNGAPRTFDERQGTWRVQE